MSKMVKKSKNLKKISKNLKKSYFFEKNFIFFLPQKKRIKNASLLVFQYQEDAIRAEFSSPARFRNTKILKNLKNSLLFLFFYFCLIFFSPEKNAILLVFQYQEDAIRPELFSPAIFRIKGGSPERDGRRTDGRMKEILVSNMG